MRLGRALARAWVGYQRLLDAELSASGFARTLPDARVLRICARSTEPTISKIGRDLTITRQGASKLIAGLRDRGYVTLRPSPADRREKLVELTPRAIDYLAAQRRATRSIERRLRADLGPDGFQSLLQLLDAIAGDEQPRMSEYLRKNINKTLLTSEPEPTATQLRRRAKPAGTNAPPCIRRNALPSPSDGHDHQRTAGPGTLD